MALVANKKAKYPTFASIIADKICSGHNQNCTVVIDGKPGMGKSLASIRLAVECALEFASRLGGRPEEYFKLSHIGILTAEETLRIVSMIQPFGIYIIDDAGAEGLSARKWMSEQNEQMTKLLQTFRTNNNLVILSAPDKDFIDKIARILVNYRITMVKPMFDKGVTLGKLSLVKRIPTKDYSSNIYPFLRMNGVVFNYILFKLPPDKLRWAYEKRRKRIEREMNSESSEKFSDLIKGKIDKTEVNPDKKNPELRKVHAVMYKSGISNGQSAADALAAANEATGLQLSERTVQRNIKTYKLSV